MAKAKDLGKRKPPLEMPEPIDATPEEVAEVVLRAKPKTEWKYLNRRRRVPETPGPQEDK